MVLLDTNDSPLHSISIPVSAYTGVEKLVTKTELFESNLDVLISTRKMAFTITMLSGPALSENSLGGLKLRSSATGYFSIK